MYKRLFFAGAVVLMILLVGFFSARSRAGYESNACAISISPGFQAFGSSAGNGTINVTSGCNWTATTGYGWITLNPGATGSGNGSFGYSVASNGSTESRIGSILAGGKFIPITQSNSGGNCTITPITVGQTVSGSLTTGDCRSIGFEIFYADLYTFSGQAGQRIVISQTASSMSSSWETYLTLFGPDGVEIAFNKNESSSSTNSRIPPGSTFFILPLNGNYIIEATSWNANVTGSYNLSITEPAGSTCTYDVFPSPVGMPAQSATISLIETSLSNCEWTAFSAYPWIQVNGSLFANGSGNGVINATLTANTSQGYRIGKVLIAGKYVTFIQDGTGGNNCLDVGSGTTTNITVPGAKSGTWAAGDCAAPYGAFSDLYWFTGIAGQEIAISLTTTSSFSNLILYGPNGQPIMDLQGSGNLRIPGGTGHVTLPVNGAYIIDAGSGVAGSYSLNVSIPSTQPSCPTVSGINPSSGAVGNSVTITGTNFTGVTAVKFANNVSAQFTINSDTSITATVPAGAITGAITISKTGCNDVSSSNFTVTGGGGGGCATPGFATAVNYTSGTSPVGVAVQDFNKDGKPDMAVSNYATDNVSIFLNNGSGGFGSATNIAAGDGPTAIASADFNGDSNYDLVSVNYLANTVSYLPGITGGGFASPTNYAVGTNPRNISVADFNGDGKPDLAVANWTSNSVSVLINNGAGFTAGPTLPAGTQTLGVVTGDFNGDGKQDIAASNGITNNVSIFIGNGNGTFGGAVNYPTGTRPFSVAAGDLNGDSKLDLATANYDANSISVLIGNGTGSFSAPVNYALSAIPINVTISDLNQDGKLDIAAAVYGGNQVAVLKGDGSGSFAAPVYFTVGTNPNFVAPADINGDGRVDLAVTNYQSASVSVLLNNCASTQCPTVSGINPTSGSIGATVTITGANLTGVSAVKFAGNISATFTVVNDTTINATVPNGAATGVITLSKSGCNDVQTASFQVTTSGNNPVPVLLNLYPNAAVVCDPPFTLSVGGTGFINGSVIRWNGTDLATTFINSTQLTATVSASLLASQGTATIGVFNPLPGGGLSNTVNFTIYANGSLVWDQSGGPETGDIEEMAYMGEQLFAGTFSGHVFTSFNNGQNWIDITGGQPFGTIWDLMVTGSNIFVGCNDGVYLSSNKGLSWTKVGNGLPAGRTIFALGANGSRLFAWASSTGMYISDNNGGLWTFSNSGLPVQTVNAIIVNGSTIFAGGAAGIYVSTNNGQSWTASNTGLQSGSSTAYVVSLSLSGGNILAGSSGGGLFSSSNNGQSWTQITNGLSQTLTITDIGYSAPYTLISTSGQGVYLSTSNGLAWSNATFNLSDLYARSVMVAPTGIFVGTQSAGVFLLGAGDVWSPMNSGLRNGWITDFEMIGSTLFAGTGRSGIFKSTNNGQSWTAMNSGLPSIKLISDIVVGNGLIFAANSTSVYVSSDNGQNWTLANSTPFPATPVTKMAIIGSNLFAGTTGGGMSISTNNGATFTTINNGFPVVPGSSIQELFVDGVNLYAAGSLGIYVTSNNGQSWTALPNGQTTGAVIALAKIGNAFFAGTYTSGVYVSTNNGANWSVINNGLTNLTVYDLATYGSNLYAATGGGGVFVTSNNGQSWSPVSIGLRSLDVRTLKVSGNLLFAGTYGGSVHVAGLDQNTCQQACPTVSGINPTSGLVGSTVTISGTNFTGVTGVKFSSNVTASFTIVNDTTITATVPGGATTGPITISKSGCNDVQTVTFTVSFPLCPTVSGINPQSGNTGTTVTISGAGFTGVSSVKFPNNLTAQYTVVSDSQIMATVPAGATSGFITISKSGCNDATTLAFSIVNCATASQITPSSGLVGSTVTISGANFTGVSAVRFFNNVTASFTVVNDTTITATVPNGAATGPITLSKAGCNDLQTQSFTVTVLCPAVAAISPTSGGTGTPVTITGTNFTGVSSVKFANNITAGFTVVNSTTITTTVPASAVSGPITLSKPGCNDAQSVAFVITVSGCTTASFASAVNYATGSEPLGVTIADFNSDGKPDIATPNSSANSISVLFGDGAGGFLPASTYPAGNGPYAIIAGDFNGDGKPDLVTANYLSNNVGILLNTGSGAFGGVTYVNVGTRPRAIATTDFNNDGKPDLAVANSNSNTVSILLGNGNGGFGLTATLTTGSAPFAITTGDFNNDGKKDVAIANSNSNNISVFIGSGSGSFGPAQLTGTGVMPSGILTADFNGDGNIDLVTANSNGDNLAIIFGSGNGSFGGPTYYSTPSQPNSVTAVDVNQDGKLDLAATNYGSNTVSVLLGNGSGGFGAVSSFNVGSGPPFIVTGDFNGDSRPDLVIANRYSNAVSVLLNSCTSQSLNPAITINPPALDFGSVASGQTKDLTLTIGNTGSAALLVTSINITDSRFTVVSPQSPFNVAAAGQLTLTVRFAPTAGGSAGATLTINSNDPAKPAVSLTLTGNGLSCATISGINPSSGLAGSTVTISGTNFTGVSAVKFSNNVTASFTIVNDTTITAIVPAGATTGPITISKPSCNDLQTASFTVIVPLCPTVSGINPSSGLVGSTVTISGTNLTGVTALKFSSNVTASFTIVNDTTITATIPNGAVTGPITISKPSCSDLQTASFTVIVPLCPTVSGINPSSGLVGSTVTISGTNLTGVTALKFSNNVTATFTIVNDTTITATIPNGAVTGPITISKPNCSDLQTATFTVTQPCVTISISTSLTGTAGGTLTVPLTVGDLTGKGVISYEFVLTYDPTVLRPQTTPYDRTGTLSSGLTVSFNTAINGEVRLSAFGATALAGSGTLLNLKFDVIGQSSSCSNLTLTSFKFNEGIPCATITSGRACVTGGSISGEVSYCITPRAVPGVLITAAGSPAANATTNNSGAFVLNGLGSGAYTVTPTKTGDTNGISSFDAALVSQQVVGMTTLSECQRLAGDASGDGSLSSFDAALIAQYSVGISNPASKVGTWKFVPVNRTYPGISGNQTGQNFSAILVGDVSGNWAPVSALALSFDENGMNGIDRPVPSVQATFPPMSAMPGTVATIPITISDMPARGILAYDLDLEYNHLVLSLLDSPVEIADTLSSSMIVTVNDNSGHLRISAFGNYPMSSTGILLKLRFRVIGQNGSMSGLIWKSVLFNEGQSRVRPIDGSLRVVPTFALSLTPGTQTITVGNKGVLTAVLSAPLSSDTLLVLRSSDPRIATAPDSVIIPAGKTVVSFDIFGRATGGQVMISAGLPQIIGSLSTNATISIDHSVFSVSAASFLSDTVAAQSIAVAFGSDFSDSTEAAASQPLPTVLAGARVEITDSLGATRSAPLFFVSPGQVNYQIPEGTAGGTATITISSRLNIATGLLNITPLAPGLFSANSDGQGVAAAVVTRAGPDGSLNYEPVAAWDEALGRFTAIPVDLGSSEDRICLILYGTGIRSLSGKSNIRVSIDGLDAPVLYAGSQGTYAGLDQINVLLNRNLAGRGVVTVAMVVDGMIANFVTINIR